MGYATPASGWRRLVLQGFQGVWFAMLRLRTIFAVLIAATSVLTVQPAAAFSTDSSSARSVADTTRRLDQATARLAQLNDQVEQGQAKLDLASRQLDADATSVAKLNTELGGIARFQYEQPTLVMRLVAIRSFSELMADMSQTRIVSNRRQALLEKQKELRRRDQQLRDQAELDVKSIRTAQADAATVAASAQTELASAQAEEVRLLATQVAAQAVVTSTRATTVSPARQSSYTGGGQIQGGGGVSVGNHFDNGYCTWYVATRRNVPWFGNANQWWPNARAYGFAEGYQPQVGAIMVTAESGYGHVAYVEAVNPDGSWVVSEMNYAGWGYRSTRTIRHGQVPLVGFIY